MEWNEINDPDEDFIFGPNWWTGITDYFYPEDVQDRFNEDGVMRAVMSINDFYRHETKKPIPLKLGRIEGKKAVIAQEIKIK